MREKDEERKGRVWEVNTVWGDITSRKIRQRKVKKIDYVTVMEVFCTENSELIESLIRPEPKLARITGFQMKIIDKVELSLLIFSRKIIPNHCEQKEVIVFRLHMG